MIQKKPLSIKIRAQNVAKICFNNKSRANHLNLNPFAQPENAKPLSF